MRKLYDKVYLFPAEERRFTRATRHNKVSRIHLDIFLTNLNGKNWLLNDPDDNLLKQLMSSS